MLDILLVDDHPVVRHGLRALLHRALPEGSQFHEAAHYRDAQQVLAVLPGMGAAIVDGRMGSQASPLLIEQLAQCFPQVPLVVMVQNLDPALARRILGLPSVHGVLAKSAQPELICQALKAALQGQKLGDLGHLTHASPVKTSALLATEGAYLPPRLAQIHHMIREGRSNKMIAHLLGLSEGTVKNYVSDILKLLQVRNRTQASHCMTETATRVYW